MYEAKRSQKVDDQAKLIDPASDGYPDRNAAFNLTRRQALFRAGAFGIGMTALPTVLSACGSSSSTVAGNTDVSAAATGGEEAIISKLTRANVPALTWVLPEPPGNLDVTVDWSRAKDMILAPAVEGLVTLDDKGGVVPLLAESWEQVDAKTYVYNLRPNVKFWNGDDLTIEDVVFSLKRSSSPEAGTSFYWGPLESVEATGPRQVSMKLSQPNAIFETIPTIFAGWIVQKKYVEEAGSRFGSAAAPMMGTGPYEISDFSPERGTTIRRFEGYWGQKPPVESVTFSVIQDEEDRLLAAQANEFDGTFDVGITQASQWESNTDFAVGYVNDGWWAWIALNNDVPPFDDVHVRRALAHLVDREGMVSALLGGRGEPANTIPPPEQWEHLITAAEARKLYQGIPTYDFDPEAAKAELEKSRYPDGFSATIRTSRQYPRITAAAESLAHEAAPLGIKIKIEEQPDVAWQQDNLNQKTEMTAGIFLPDYLDPVDNAYYILRSEFATKDNYNFANYRNKQVDRDLDKAFEIQNKQQRVSLIMSALKQAAEDVPWIPLWWEQEPVALRKEYAFSELGPWFLFRQWAVYLGERA